MYAESLSGNPTASGEIYSPGKATAASLEIPLNTSATVVSAGDATKRVRVRVNDRGPYGDARRIVDLSSAAFTQLASVSQGVTQVCIYWN